MDGWDSTHWYYYCLSDKDMRDENEKRIFKAIKEGDIETLKEIKNPIGCRLGIKDLPILSVAVLSRHRVVIEFLIDQGCDPREVDKNGNNGFYLLVLELVLYKEEKLGVSVIDILLSVCSNAVEAVFVDANKKKMTPFLLACVLQRDAIITSFLTLLENDSIPIPLDRFIAYKGENVFHLLLKDFNLSPTRMETLRAAVDKISVFDKLIDKKNGGGSTPLQQLLHHIGYEEPNKELIELAKLLFTHGACRETRDKYGWNYLDYAISNQNVSLVEILLRVGCRTERPQGKSLLSYILTNHWRKSKPQSIRMIELLLAFGYDLQKEFYLYTFDERPQEFMAPVYVHFRESGVADGLDGSEILRTLQELRRSNQLLSLQRQCRNTIRRCLKAKADEVIGNLTCIPPSVKSFLLVENENPLLEITE